MKFRKWLKKLMCVWCEKLHQLIVYTCSNPVFTPFQHLTYILVMMLDRGYRGARSIHGRWGLLITADTRHQLSRITAAYKP